MFLSHFQMKKQTSREMLSNLASSQEIMAKSSQFIYQSADNGSPVTSRRPGVPRIQLTYESDEFEDIDADDGSESKKKKSKHRSTLRRRKTASMPTLNRQSSWSSEDSEKFAKICIHDKQEAMSIFSKILNIEYTNSEGTDSDKVVPVIKVKRHGALRRSLKIPFKYLNGIKVLPTEAEIESQTEPPELFTKLDIASRLVFPSAFVLVLIMYSLYFAYYLTDEWNKEDDEL